MIRDCIDIASRRPIVIRGLKYGFVVGLVLIAINHGNAFVEGTVDTTRILQMVLTMLVPYFVSTASSVAAVLDHRAENADA